MIDLRHKTFLELCAFKNYTKTAEHLHITQPAVTQHIQYLEQKYNCKLFSYESKKLTLTPEGEKLQELLVRIVADTNHFKRNLESKGNQREDIVFGATLSIGEYLMPRVITEILRKNSRLNIHMEVGNSQVLLEKLQKGDLDFALIEGVIDKSRYHSLLFSLEKFIPVCSPQSVLARGMVDFSAILQSSLVLREEGSGTREIFENILKQYNYSLTSFDNIIEIGNMAAIKKLVASNLGITFLYEIVVEAELSNGQLAMIDISGFDVTREFNFVFLKDSVYASKYMEYFQMLKEAERASQALAKPIKGNLP
ncbi:MAG: LysR family transcriptional regulator [Firmicutes bacterium]|nr:LysR family transcriptional regulator [Bacillota bacterium]